VARMRGEIEKASRGLKAQLSEELQPSGAADDIDEPTACSACAHPSDL